MTKKSKHVSELKSKLNDIKNQGYILATRNGNTAIGKTLEDCLDKEEDNKPEADFHDIEIKAKRKDSKSSVTLFTKAPTFPEQANSILKDNYGVRKDNDSEKKIHTTVRATKFNSFKGKNGFKLEVDRKNERRNILIEDKKSKTIVDENIGYDFESLKSIVEGKIKNLAVVSATTKKTPEGEMFHYQDGDIYSGANFDKFLDLVEQGKIQVDIRIGEYPDGRTHDHGTAFRIKTKDIEGMYDSYESLDDENLKDTDLDKKEK